MRNPETEMEREILMCDLEYLNRRHMHIPKPFPKEIEKNQTQREQLAKN